MWLDRGVGAGGLEAFVFLPILVGSVVGAICKCGLRKTIRLRPDLRAALGPEDWR